MEADISISHKPGHVYFALTERGGTLCLREAKRTMRKTGP